MHVPLIACTDDSYPQTFISQVMRIPILLLFSVVVCDAQFFTKAQKSVPRMGKRSYDEVRRESLLHIFTPFSALRFQKSFYS